MRELLACWQSTRMIVLIGLCAALYTAVVFAFKWLPIVPGLTEIRPGASLPIVFSLFFGPVAAWGTAFGNIVGDLMGGTIGPGSFFGIFGNFFYGYVPYRVARAFGANSSNLISTRKIGVFILAVVLASAACATIISLGVDFLGLVPFDLLEHAILLNNILMSFILAPLLIRGLDKRIRQMKLNYEQLLEPEQISKPTFGVFGSLILLILIALIYACMMIPAFAGSIAGNAWFEIAAVIVIILASLVLL
jgi:energy-coupling factor transport system substrate-specific component